MTDPDLVYRAEQAYLGAVLARHGQTGTSAAGDSGLPAVTHAGDFTDPVHQAIFAAITGQPHSTRPDGPSGWLGRLRDLLERLFSSRARQAAAYLAELPSLCPDPANLPAYAAMVAEASQDRAQQARARQAEQASVEDPTLASAGAWLDKTEKAMHPAGRRQNQAYLGADPATGPEPAARPSAPGVPSPQLDAAAAGLAPDTARLARALRTDARRATRPDQAPRLEQPADRPTSAAGPVLRAGTQPAALNPEYLEDRVLASLMKHPAEERAVIEWLPAEVFSTAPHRDLYDLIRDRLASGRPVDPLIIAWDASRLPDGSFSGEYGGSAFLTQAAFQIGALDPAPGTAAVLGRALRAERLLISTLGEHWLTDPELIRLAALVPGEPTHQPVTAPGQGGPAAVPEPTAAGPRAASTAIAEQPAAAQRPAPAPPAPAQQAAPQPLPLRQPPAPHPGGPVLRM